MDSDTTYDFYIEADQYVIYLRNQSERQRPLVIDRITQEVKPADYEQPFPNDVSAKPSTVYGILGTIRLLSGRYLLTVDKRELVGKLFGHKIYRALECSVHPFAKSTSNLNEEEMEIETTYIEMLKNVLGIEGFYFSHTYDLTLTQQRLSELGPDAKRQNLFEKAERRFVWNGFLLNDWCGLVSAALNAPPVYAWPKLGSFITPVIFGFVEILQPTTPSTAYAPEDKPCYALISRRSVFRAGTRFYARGVDKDANAANTVETEQIVYIPTGNFFSFVQIRGSVPLFWSQRPNLKYKPPVKMGHGRNEPANLAEVQNGKEEKDELLGQVQVAPEQVAILKQHFHEVCFTQRYGRTVAINLLDEKGMERRLCRSYALASQSVDQAELKYESFDFHRECSALKWHRLSILLDRLEPEIVAMRQLRLRSSGPTLTASVVEDSQTGVFRTNCIDCLDRTNVVQSMIAWRALELGLQQAHLASVVGRGSRRERSDFMQSIWPDFEQAFKDVWADHADALSVQYSGTKALKTDFTRTGQRTLMGMLMDGYHSAKRYYLSNFADGYLQDAFNLFLGHLSVFEDDGSPKKVLRAAASDSALRSKFLPVVFAFATSMSVLCLIFPGEDLWSERLVYFLFWGTASVVSALTIYTFGEDFVNKPRLLID